jgi:hypothetical protein
MAGVMETTNKAETLVSTTPAIIKFEMAPIGFSGTREKLIREKT